MGEAFGIKILQQCWEKAAEAFGVCIGVRSAMPSDRKVRIYPKIRTTERACDGGAQLVRSNREPRAWVRFARREAPPRTAGLPPTAERFALTEWLHFRSRRIHVRAEAAAFSAIASGSQHKTISGDQVSDCRVAVGVGADELGHVADRRGFGFDAPALSRRRPRPEWRLRRNMN
jgi:hypothetical protein